MLTQILSEHENNAGLFVILFHFTMTVENDLHTHPMQQGLISSETPLAQID